MTTLNNFQLWQALMALANTQQNGFIRPDLNFTTWLNEVNNEMFQLYAEQFGRNQQLSDKLAPFATYVNAYVTPVSGAPYDRIVLPNNYEYLININIIRQKDEPQCFCSPKYPYIDGTGECQQFTDPDIAAIKAQYAGNNLIERLVYDIDNQRWERAMEHAFNYPSWDDPMVTQIAEQDGTRTFRIAPKGIQAVVLYYLRTPAQAVFNYTWVGQNVVYDPLTSVNLEWSNVLQNEFLYRMLKKYGNYVGQPALVQTAEEYLSKL